MEKTKPKSVAEIEVARVDGPPGKAIKFIIAEISDASSKKAIFRTARNQQTYHNDIGAELKKELKDDTGVDVKGGGRLLIDDGSKSIWIWGKSNVYGYPNYAEARDMLKSIYPDFKIIIIPYLKKQGATNSEILDREADRSSFSAKNIMELIKDDETAK